MLNLPTEIILILLTFLNEKDLISLILLTSKQEFDYAKIQIRNYLMNRLKIKWSLSDVHIYDISLFRWENSINNLSLSYYANLLFLALAPLDGLRGDSPMLKIFGNLCTFEGYVGQGNRSVVSIQPFPSQKEFSLTSLADINYLFKSYVKEAFKIFSGCKNRIAKFSAKRIVMSNRRGGFFSMPFINSDNLWFTHPRQIYYFEVEIESLVGQSLRLDNELDCVAVGLSTKRFLHGSRMPGWDDESFGYHGDDGAIFHGRGRPLSLYGPSFGVGDVVGCGLNLEKRCIFYTLNGKYLGVAFKNLNTKIALYPTVGIDAAVQIQVNFGRRRFHFNLGSLIKNWQSDDFTSCFKTEQPPNQRLMSNLSNYNRINRFHSSQINEIDLNYFNPNSSGTQLYRTSSDPNFGTGTSNTSYSTPRSHSSRTQIADNEVASFFSVEYRYYNRWIGMDQ